MLHTVFEQKSLYHSTKSPASFVKKAHICEHNVLLFYVFHKKSMCIVQVHKIKGQTIDLGRKNKGQIRDRTSKNMEENRGQY